MEISVNPLNLNIASPSNYGDCMVTLDHQYRTEITLDGEDILVEVPLVSFVATDGSRFDWQHRAPREVQVQCQDGIYSKHLTY